MGIWGKCPWCNNEGVQNCTFVLLRTRPVYRYLKTTERLFYITNNIKIFSLLEREVVLQVKFVPHTWAYSPAVKIRVIGKQALILAHLTD